MSQILQKEIMDKRQRAQEIYAILKKAVPDVTIPLHHSSAMDLLVATILSAQCTDERVNTVTPALFKKYKTAKDYANADMDELRELIRSTGFFNNKAKNIIGATKKIVSDFGGEVPDSMADLTTLPGVARKTANVVLSQWFKKNEGIAVDTHVIRLSNLLGLTKEKNPVKIERDLMELFDREDWCDVSLRLIYFGRRYAPARKEWDESNPLYEYLAV